VIDGLNGFFKDTQMRIAKKEFKDSLQRQKKQEFVSERYGIKYYIC
jgi:hypothetical protein